MCGIAGIITKDTSLLTSERLKKMTDIISHRGPDGEGQWISVEGHVGLGHRRLSIIDLSHDADQPMHYLGRYSIVFNGEIYNYLELRDMLQKQGYSFKTKSDTEVLMALYDRDKEKCLQLLDGMFAFVLYDAKENEVFCARDRFGEKPFFYNYEKGKHFYFGSEMKSLWAGGIQKEINGQMMFNYLSFGYIENPRDLGETFYKGCTRLEHSHYIRINTHTMEMDIHRYYDIEWKQIDEHITMDHAKQKLEELFNTSVARRLRSDVTVGSSLSGGLDSSLVVCTIDGLKKGTAQKQNTFSAVFPGYEKDERKFMDYVIEKTNVKPHFVTPDDEGLMRDLEKLSWHQEEPYGSASIYAQYCVMRLAKENNTTVLLDGQGADEILAGYHQYYQPFFKNIRNKSDYSVQLARYNELHRNNPINGITRKGLGDYVRSFSPALIRPAKKLVNLYRQTTNPVLNREFYHEYKNDIFTTPGNSHGTLNEALYMSTMKYGLQQLLRYADRNSMAHSREVRLPFLSHELVDFVFTLPPSFKIDNGWTKMIMRETFDILPPEIRWRTDKIGYEPPQKSWMENAVIQNMIRESRSKLIRMNYFDKNVSEKPVIPQDQGMRENNWTTLMAGEII